MGRLFLLMQSTLEPPIGGGARRKIDWPRIVLFGLIIVLSLVLGFVSFDAVQAVGIVRRFGYFSICAAFVAFAGTTYRLVDWAGVIARWRAGGWKVVFLVLGISGSLHLQEPHGFKVVNDEFVQISTSQRMHLSREASTVARGFQFGTEFVPMQGQVDKRPLFYPFLLSLVHDLTGYRPANAFGLNALLTPVLLGLIYLVIRDVIGRSAGICAVLLVATLPLLAQTVTGSGFETLNLVMIVVTILLGLRYAERPTAIALGAFCLSGVLLAQVRYESVLFLLPVAAVMLYMAWRTRSIELPWPVLISPLLLIIYPLQLNVFKVRPELWQLSDRPSDGGVYSLAYFYDNVGKALRYFLSWDGTHPNSHLVALAGAAGLGFFFVYLFREHRKMIASAPKQTVFAIFIFALFGQAILMMCYFWGAYDEPITVRLSLPTQLLFVLTFVFIYPLLVTAKANWRSLGAVSVLYFMSWTVPTIAQRAYASDNLAAETANWQREFMSDREDRTFFVIEQSMPLFWLTHEVACTPIDVLAQRWAEFAYHFKRQTFTDYYIVQKLAPVDFETGELRAVPAADLGDAVMLEPVRQLVLRPNYVIRMSRITSVDEARLKKWADSFTNQSAGPAPAPESHQLGVEEKAFIAEWLEKLP